VALLDDGAWQGRLRTGAWTDGSGDTPFSSLDEVVELARGTEYGLSLGILTRDVHAGLQLAERIPSGLVHVNDRTVNDEAVAPFGGVGASGTGSGTAARRPTSRRSPGPSG
jgi:acyl-CoA reductase-like NAD-dependent aldehyde dehydrogenase